MDDIVIKCEGISKRYEIGERERYLALRDSLTGALYLLSAPRKMVYRPPPGTIGTNTTGKNRRT